MKVNKDTEKTFALIAVAIALLMGIYAFYIKIRYMQKHIEAIESFILPKK